MSSAAPKQENLLLNLAFNLAIPWAALSYLSKPERLGPTWALVVAVNAGHGINYVNVAEIRTLPGVHELNIGHSIIARALSTGIEEAVREMKTRMNPAG